MKFPAAGDAKAVLREVHREGGSHVCLVYDISKAHRRVPVVEEDWGRQACQIRGTAASAWKMRKRMRASEDRARAPGSSTVLPPDAPFVMRREEFTEEELEQTVWLNTVGTFGVASAGYWWGVQVRP